MDKPAPQKKTAQIVDAIWALDLEPIKFKLMDRDEGEGWSADEVDHYEKEYKRFLTLLVKHPEKTIAPNKKVDAFWHAHILDTMKYAEDCDKVFGYFLHHYPYFGLRGEDDAKRLAEAFETMQNLHRDEFGDEQAAYCGLASAKGLQDASYCGAAVKQVRAGAAYCGVAATKDENKAAYCGIAADKGKQGAAYCGIASVAGPQDAAYCGLASAKGGQESAYCGATLAKKKDEAAYCGIASVMQGAAYCGATMVGLRDEVSYCGAASANGLGEVAYCGVASVRVRDEAARPGR